MNVQVMSDEKLAQSHERLAQQRTTIVEQLQAVHDEQDRRLSSARVSAMLDGMSADDRAKLRAALDAGKG